MATPPVSDAVIKKRIDTLNRCGGNQTKAAELLGITRYAVQDAIKQAEKRNLIQSPPVQTEPEPAPSPFAIEHAPQVASVDGAKWVLQSTKDNKFIFGAMGDLHAASKYTRWEVREDLMKRAVNAGATCIFDTGNWIDGEASFNRYDIEASGLDNQVALLARNYPKLGIPTFAVTGDDHEGWYIRREGIDVGRYCESVMRDEGHDWTDLGYMEADILLKNVNSGASSILRVVHPGGGTGYALSYRPQKIIESYEGGEKPAVVLFGHYHKLDCNNVRNVWSVQTGCAQDQTPFMRKKSLEAHVGGAIIEMEQDPKTGAIIGFRPDLRRYFNRSYYVAEGQANNRWSGHGKPNMIPRRMGSR
jgi:hypothetical protein